MTSLAAHPAEKIFIARYNWVGSRADFENIYDVVLTLVGSREEAGADLIGLRVRTENKLRPPLT